MQKANAKAVRGDIDSNAVSTFTFNDTVLIVFRTPSAPTLKDIEHFCLLLRKFAVDSLARGILFRGSVSIGNFYVDDDSNTVMGKAITDAAAWYDSADWVGINATPHAILMANMLADAQHIAMATVATVDALVSWNFRHVVNLPRIHGYHGVNAGSGTSQR